MPTSLPINIDTTYADNGGDASVKLHQQHHDTIDAAVNNLTAAQFPVEEYGAVGNGSTDDYTAFANAATAAASNGWIVLRPGKTYALASQWSLPSNTKIWAYGATIKATSTGLSDRVVVCSDVSNIRIHGLTINGDKASIGGVTEQRHGFHLIGVAGVRLVDVNSSSCKGDGIYVGRGTSAGCSDLIAERSVFNANHRNAMSLIDIAGGKFIDCEFTNTTGTAPQDGIDLEPNITANAITDITLIRCKMNGNTGDGLAFNRLSGAITPDVARFKTVDCEIKNNGLRGVIVSWVSPAARLDFVNTDVESNGRFGYSLEPTANTGDIKIRGGSIRTNQWAGMQLQPGTGATQSRVLIEGVSVIDNSVVGAATYDAIQLFSRNVRVTIANCILANVAASNQGVPVWCVDTTVTNLRLIGNTYNTVSPPVLDDDAATRVDVGNNMPGTVTDMSTITVNIRTASYTLTKTDAGKLVEMNVATANTLTVPPNSSVPFPTNTRIRFRDYGAGRTTLTQGAGVTIRGTLVSPGQYREGWLTKRSTDEWVAAWST